MTTIYTPYPVKLDDLWTTVELHVLDHGQLPKRLGHRIKGMGGTYTSTRGHSTKRYVTLPAYAARTIEDIYAMFKVECAVLRGSTLLRRDLQGITSTGTVDRVVQVPKGADPLTMLYGEVRTYSNAEWANAECLAQARAEAQAASLLQRAAQARAAAVERAAPAMLAALQVIAKTPSLRDWLAHVDAQALAQVDAAINAATGELREVA